MLPAFQPFSLKANVDIARGALTTESVNNGIGDYKLGDITKTMANHLEAYDERVQSLKSNPLIDQDLPQAPETYKARPLNGIWATAPFLHNGSVPNLKEILLPADQRSKTFFLGTREYDPATVGYLNLLIDLWNNTIAVINLRLIQT